MSLGIVKHGIVYRADDGACYLYRPGKNGGRARIAAVPSEIADPWQLASGDIVDADTEDVFGELEPLRPLTLDPLEQVDEPAAARGHHIPSWFTTHSAPAEQVTSIRSVNGLEFEAAVDRPSARRRSPSERRAPGRQLVCATSPNDVTGRMLDFAAPLGFGCAGAIIGPHGSGLTRTLRSVVAGSSANAQDVHVIVLLLRARGEECSDWRRRMPEADIVVCPSPSEGATADQTLRMAMLALACAQRQSELGNHVLLAIDSLTALWGSLLESETADAQRESDRSAARLEIRRYLQCAGDFSGEGPLGGSTGGSITIIGTIWSTQVDSEAEEEGEVHPHLRLLEHVIHELSWRVTLRGDLATRREFPAIDVWRARSLNETEIVGAAEHGLLEEARRELSALSDPDRIFALRNAIESTPDTEALFEQLSRLTLE